MKYNALDFSLAGDKYLGQPYSSMDCQAFVEKCMADVGLRMDLGGSNSWFRECIKHGWTGTPEECVRRFGGVPKGALLFILEPVSASTPGKFRSDGIGDATHMGIATGRGDGAIHSSSSRGCVCTSKFKNKTIPNGGWNRVGLYDRFDYGNPFTWLLDHDAGAAPSDPGASSASIAETAVPDIPTSVPATGAAAPAKTASAPATGTAAPAKPSAPAVSFRDGTSPQTSPGKENISMKAYVTAQSGSQVKLRQKPSTDCPIWWNIPVGSELQILDRRQSWSKCVCGGLTGWMMNDFIRMEGEEGAPVVSDADGRPATPGMDGTSFTPGPDGLPIAPEPLETEPELMDDYLELDPMRPGSTPASAASDPEKTAALSLLADVYETLRSLCDRIVDTVGRG